MTMMRNFSIAIGANKWLKTKRFSFSCLSQLGYMLFCPKQGQVFKPSAAHLYPGFYLYSGLTKDSPFRFHSSKGAPRIPAIFGREGAWGKEGEGWYVQGVDIRGIFFEKHMAKVILSSYFLHPWGRFLTLLNLFYHLPGWLRGLPLMGQADDAILFHWLF